MSRLRADRARAIAFRAKWGRVLTVAPSYEASNVRMVLLSSEEVEATAAIELRSSAAYDSFGVPHVHGPLSLALGAERSILCLTCSNTASNTHCGGHYGAISLQRHMYHPLYYAEIKKLLSCVCYACSSPLKPLEELEALSQRYGVCEVLTEATKLCTKVAVCPSPGCGHPQPSYKIVELSIQAIWGPDAVFESAEHERGCREGSFSAWKAYAILLRVSEPVWRALLGPASTVRASSLILSTLAVMPKTARTTLIGGAGLRRLTPQTRRIQHMITPNQNLRKLDVFALRGIKYGQGTTASAEYNTKDLQTQVYHTIMGDSKTFEHTRVQRNGNTAKQGGSVRDLMDGKHKLTRRQYVGKRVNESARMTVTAAHHGISAQMDVIPQYCARTLSTLIEITRWNVEAVKWLVAEGGYHCVFVETPTGELIEMAHLSPVERAGLGNLLTPGNGWKVHAALTYHACMERGEENWIDELVNRAPTLHAAGLMDTQMVVNPNPHNKTQQLPHAVAPAYNADYDGDEMQVHVVQHPPAQGDVRLMAVARHVTGLTTSAQLIAPSLNPLLGAYMLTEGDVWIPKSVGLAMMAAAGVHHVSGSTASLLSTLPPPVSKHATWVQNPWFSASLETVGWTGRQLINALLPSYMAYKSAKATIERGKLTNGALDKSVLGVHATGIFALCRRDEGALAAIRLVDVFIAACEAFLDRVGLSIGVRQLVQSGPMRRLAHTLADRVSQAIKDAGTALSTTPQKREYEQASVANSALSLNGDLVASRMKKKDLFAVIVRSGAKGSMVDAAMLKTGLGQQTIRGARLGVDMDTGRFLKETIPCILEPESDPLARGFIKNGYGSVSPYMVGLEPAEYFEHAIASRDALAAIASMVPQTGNFNRKLARGTQHVFVAGFCPRGPLVSTTLRQNMLPRAEEDSTRAMLDAGLLPLGQILQFHYGGHGCSTQSVFNTAIPCLSDGKLSGHELEAQLLADGVSAPLAHFAAACRATIFKLTASSGGILPKTWPTVFSGSVEVERMRQLAERAFPMQLSERVSNEEFEDMLRERLIWAFCVACGLFRDKQNSSLKELMQVDENGVNQALYPMLSHLVAAITAFTPRALREASGGIQSAVKAVLDDVAQRLLRARIPNGSAVGLIASYAIGEYATQVQLSMFHSSGIKQERQTAVDQMLALCMATLKPKGIRGVLPLPKQLMSGMQPQPAGATNNDEAVSALVKRLNKVSMTSVLEPPKLAWYGDSSPPALLRPLCQRVLSTSPLAVAVGFMAPEVAAPAGPALLLEVKQDAKEDTEAIVHTVRCTLRAKFGGATVPPALLHISPTTLALIPPPGDVWLQALRDLEASFGPVYVATEGEVRMVHGLYTLGEVLRRDEVLRGCVGAWASTFSVTEFMEENGGTVWTEMRPSVSVVDTTLILSLARAYRHHVDFERSTTSNLWEVASVLGVEAARSAWIYEMGQLCRDNISAAHIDLLADIAFYSGVHSSIAPSIKLMSPNDGFLAAAMYQQSTKVFATAALYGVKDPLHGPAAVALGRTTRNGSNMGRFSTDPEYLDAWKKAVEERKLRPNVAVRQKEDDEEEEATWMVDRVDVDVDVNVNAKDDLTLTVPTLEAVESDDIIMAEPLEPEPVTNEERKVTGNEDEDEDEQWNVKGLLPDHDSEMVVHADATSSESLLPDRIKVDKLKYRGIANVQWFVPPPLSMLTPRATGVVPPGVNLAIVNLKPLDYVGVPVPTVTVHYGYKKKHHLPPSVLRLEHSNSTIDNSLQSQSQAEKDDTESEEEEEDQPDDVQRELEASKKEEEGPHAEGGHYNLPTQVVELARSMIRNSYDRSKTRAQQYSTYMQAATEFSKRSQAALTSASSSQPQGSSPPASVASVLALSRAIIARYGLVYDSSGDVAANEPEREERRHSKCIDDWKEAELRQLRAAYREFVVESAERAAQTQARLTSGAIPVRRYRIRPTVRTRLPYWPPPAGEHSILLQTPLPVPVPVTATKMTPKAPPHRPRGKANQTAVNKRKKAAVVVKKDPPPSSQSSDGEENEDAASTDDASDASSSGTSSSDSSSDSSASTCNSSKEKKTTTTTAQRRQNERKVPIAAAASAPKKNISAMKSKRASSIGAKKSVKFEVMSSSSSGPTDSDNEEDDEEDEESEHESFRQTKKQRMNH